MNLKNGVFELVKDKNARDAFYDNAEVALDAVADDEVVKDIPVLGTLVKSKRAYASIKDRIFIKKLERFLNALEDIETSQRDIFIQGLEAKDMREKTGEKLLLIIDRQDDFNKSELIGLIFKEYIKGSIEQDVFEMLCHSVSTAYLGDLEDIDTFLARPELIDDSVGFILMAAGITKLKVTVDSLSGGTIDAIEAGASKTSNHFELTRNGEILARIIKQHRG